MHSIIGGAGEQRGSGIPLAEVRRRQSGTTVAGPELVDIAHQAAADAMLAILAKLGDFRGESRAPADLPRRLQGGRPRGGPR